VAAETATIVTPVLRALLPFLALVAVGIPARAAGRDGWWNTGWEYRIWFDVPAGDVGVVEFLSAGRLKKDLSDLRVVGASGTPAKHVVLRRRPGDDLLRVAFAPGGGDRRYAVYMKNPRAKAQRETKLGRGLLLETFEFRGGSPDNLRAMRDVLKRAEEAPFGSDYVPNVFHGHNMFGRSENYVSRYSGTLLCPRSGQYVFATTSDDASFLLIDGKLVVAWPGWHGAARDARHQSKRNLTSGAHEFEYLHVQGTAEAAAVAAWQLPGGGKVVPIPPTAFGPVGRGKFSRIERLGGKPALHFEAEVGGECWFEGRHAYRVRLRDRTGDAPSARRLEWDFGDGLRGRGGQPEHVYLRAGVFTVTMTATAGGRSEKVTNRVRVERIWAKQPWIRPEPPAACAKVVRGYDLSKLDGRSLEAAALLMKAAGAEAEEARVLEAVVSRPAEVESQVYFEAVLFLARRWREEAAARPRAMRLLAQAETHLAGNLKLRARVWRETGDVLFYYEHDLDRALGEYDKVVGRYADRLEDHIVRITKIRIGDIFRKRAGEGDFEKARANYTDAERFRLGDVKGVPSVRKGLLLQAAETHLAHRDADRALSALDVLEWEFPLEKLRGQSTVLRARAELARKNVPEALVQLDDLVRAAPHSNHAAEALFMAAEIERSRRRTAEAVRRYERLVADYRDSPRATDARTRLKSLRSRN
jgi:tetratricopeptide (TPR) repeat protein